MRGRRQFVCLDRNERVTPFSDREFKDILSGLCPEHFSAYPDPSPLLDRLEAALSVPSGWICLTNGSDAAIRKVFQTYVRPGDSVLLADPTYAMYPIYARMFGGRVELVSYNDDRSLDIAAFRRKLAARPRIAALACPDQPTGTVFDIGDLRAIVRDAREHQVLCIIDEAYFPFYPVSAIGLVKEFDNVVVTRTFSKVGGIAGLRLGYFTAHPAIVGAVGSVRGAHEVNAVAIHVGAYLLDHPEIATALVDDLEKGRSLLKRAAVDLGLRAPECPANFQLIEFPGSDQAAAIVGRLRTLGYLVKGGFVHPSVSACIRVTLAGIDVMASFADVLRQVVLS